MAKYECNKFEDISGCFQQLQTYMDTQVGEVKLRVKSVEDRVEVIENHIEYALTEFNELHNTHVPNLETKLDKEQSERLKLEMWNFVICGIEGEIDRIERPRETEMLARTFLKKVISFAEDRAHNMLFTDVHRLKVCPVGRKSVILRLSSLIDRDEILEKALKLKPGSGYSIVPDLPPSLAMRRSELLKERREIPEGMRKKIKLVYLKEIPFVDLVVIKRPVVDTLFMNKQNNYDSTICGQKYCNV